jgi:HEAT repeats
MVDRLCLICLTAKLDTPIFAQVSNKVLRIVIFLNMCNQFLYRLITRSISLLTTVIIFSVATPISQAASSCQAEDVEPYVEMLSEDSFKILASDQIIKTCGQSAVPHLAKILQREKDLGIRSQIISILTKLGGDSANQVPIIKVLVDILQNLKLETSLRQEAASSLGKIGGTTVVAPLVNAMKNLNNPLAVRQSAGLALVSVKDPAIASLESFIKDPNSSLQNKYWAIRALVMIDTPKSKLVLGNNRTKVLAALEEALKIPNKIVELGRGLGRPLICRWSWAMQNWSKCR